MIHIKLIISLRHQSYIYFNLLCTVYKPWGLMGYSEESWEVKATMFHCQQSKHRCLIISLYDGNQNQRATEFTIKNFFTQEFWDLTQHVRFFFHHKVQAKWIWSQKLYSEYIIHITFLAVCSRLQNSPGGNGEGRLDINSSQS